jgi:enoyl-CoA hydratase/carnithine racemase
VVVLTGSGRAFSSGLDLKDHGVVPNIDGLQVGRIAQKAMRHYSRLVPTLRRLPQPVIAAVNGPAYGGGMCLALGADLRFAAASATFNSTGIVNGLTSTELGVSWLLPRLIGVARSNDLLLTGRVVDSAEALAMGLVSRILADDELLEACLDVAEAMCRYSPYGLAMTKDVIWANLEVGTCVADGRQRAVPDARRDSGDQGGQADCGEEPGVARQQPGHVGPRGGAHRRLQGIEPLLEPVHAPVEAVDPALEVGEVVLRGDVRPADRGQELHHRAGLLRTEPRLQHAEEAVAFVLADHLGTSPPSTSCRAPEHRVIARSVLAP